MKQWKSCRSGHCFYRCFFCVGIRDSHGSLSYGQFMSARPAWLALNAEQGHRFQGRIFCFCFVYWFGVCMCERQRQRERERERERERTCFVSCVCVWCQGVCLTTPVSGPIFCFCFCFVYCLLVWCVCVLFLSAFRCQCVCVFEKEGAVTLSFTWIKNIVHGRDSECVVYVNTSAIGCIGDLCVGTWQ